MFFPRVETIATVFKQLHALTRMNGSISVVWSIPKDNEKYLPRDAMAQAAQTDSFLFVNWVPQPELLAHPSTKLFITYAPLILTNAIQIFLMY